MADVNTNGLEMSVPFFGRPGKPVGAEVWDQGVADELGQGRSIDAIEQGIAARFADQAEATDLFGVLEDAASGNREQCVTGILNAAQTDDAASVQNKGAVAKDATDRFLATGAVFTDQDGDGEQASDAPTTTTNEDGEFDVE